MIPKAVEDIEIRKIIYDHAAADAHYRSCVGHTKRLLERFAADNKFREKMAVNPVEACQDWGLLRHPEHVRSLWDLNQPAHQRRAESAAALRYHAMMDEKRGHSDLLRTEGTPENRTWRIWRERQIKRSRSHLGRKADRLVHAPYCIELGKGCSLGCGWCAVAAEKMGTQWPYTPENRQTWRDCLEVMREILGEGARGGYCYWATDPLDNPEYEDFLMDFHDIQGSFPQTTTAQPEKHVERVKNLLKLSDENGGVIERFSVLTLKQWNAIHEAFTAEELAFVECVPQNREALDPKKVIAGRALERHLKMVELGREEPMEDDVTSTIACVSGFYINMVDRSVQLITPCNATKRWPLGHWVLDHDTFADAADLRRILLRMIKENMATSLSHRDTVRLREDLNYQPCEAGFTVSTRYQRHTVTHDADMRGIGDLIASGTHTAMDIALALDAPAENTMHFLNVALYDRGLLFEEPDPSKGDLK